MAAQPVAADRVTADADAASMPAPAPLADPPEAALAVPLPARFPRFLHGRTLRSLGFSSTIQGATGAAAMVAARKSEDIRFYPGGHGASNDVRRRLDAHGGGDEHLFWRW